MAHKKVSYTPRALITNWNIKFCMQSNCPGSSFSATYHKSNTGCLQTTSSHSLDEWFSRRCKNVAKFFLKIGMGQVYFSTLSGKILQTFLFIRMPPGPLVLGEFFAPSGFRVNGCLTKHLPQKISALTGKSSMLLW